MKRTIMIILGAALLASSLFSQSFSFDSVKAGFQGFSDKVANSLPFNASIGNNWSDAYIGQLIDLPPHFGIGLTTGMTTIPGDTLTPTLNALGITLPASLDFIKSLGVPLPSYTVDARIGGFILPFDLGLKFGYVPPELTAGLPFHAEYLLVGGDLRFALLKDTVVLPAISIGAGYTYMKGSVAVPSLMPGGMTLSSFTLPDNTTHALGFSDPSLKVGWDTSVIDLKAQISKNLLIITPYLGIAGSYAISHAGGGLFSQMTLDGAPVTQAQLDQINAATGQNLTLTDPGLQFMSAVNGWGFRAWGGLSLNLAVIRIDLNGMYNFTSGSLGATLGLRFQL